MKDIGLVFSGGGGKGPYQIGVWKYLCEVGLDKRIGAVSGTSIGAFNAALFVAGDLATVEDMWRNISPSDVLTPKRITPASLVSWSTFAAGLLATPLLDPIGIISTATVLSLANTATNMLTKQGSVFTQKGIKNKIHIGVNEKKLRSADIPCYATCLRLGVPPKAERFDLRNYSFDEVVTILLASEAIPGAFEPVSFNGSKYCDGGFTKYGDNVPVAPVYDEGMKKILVVHLSADDPTDTSKYPNAKVYDLFPSEDLGNIIKGTMDFSGESASKRIDLGYNDAKAYFNGLLNVL